MNKNRLEAFSDGVLAIIITIMVLEIKTPTTANWDGIIQLLPTFFSYMLSFAVVGVYWNNHHHLLHTVKRVSPAIMWANLNLLFWLSLIPFGTKWIGETHFERFTVIVYALFLLLCGLSYNVLQNSIARSLKGEKSQIVALIKRDNIKVLISISCVILAIPAAFIDTKISLFLFTFSTGIWIVPSKAIAEDLAKNE
jgi:uncharacterized membrane protein